MTEFGTLEIVTDVEVKGQDAEPNRETLNPVPSHTPTPPPEVHSQANTALVSQSKPGSSQAKGMLVSAYHNILPLRPFYVVFELLLLGSCFQRGMLVWRLAQGLNLDLLPTRVQTASCQSVGPVVDTFPGRPLSRENTVALVFSLPVAGEHPPPPPNIYIQQSGLGAVV